jgi:hypothetical protein
MGYYTRYELTIEEGTPDQIDKVNEDMELLAAGLCKDLLGLDDPGCWGEYMADVWKGVPDSASWYDHDKYMLALSKRHPDVVFKLHGEGEDSGDLWNTYYKNGLTQVCLARIVYDEYDEEELT